MPGCARGAGLRDRQVSNTTDETWSRLTIQLLHCVSNGGQSFVKLCELDTRTLDDVAQDVLRDLRVLPDGLVLAELFVEVLDITK